jgi:hypothetical protein
MPDAAALQFVPWLGFYGMCVRYGIIVHCAWRVAVALAANRDSLLLGGAAAARTPRQKSRQNYFEKNHCHQ